MDNDILDLEAELGRLPTARELAEFRAKRGRHGVSGYDMDQAWYEVHDAQHHRRLSSAEADERRRFNRERRGAGGN